MLLSQEITKAIQQAARELINEMQFTQIENMLLESPAKIKTKQDQFLTLQRGTDTFKRSLEEHKSIADNVKAVTEAEVIMELNGDGKLRFSNDKLRSAETTKRLADNEEYQAARRMMQGFEEQITIDGLNASMIKNEIGQLESTMANYRAILHARAAQVTAIFGRSV